MSELVISRSDSEWRDYIKEAERGCVAATLEWCRRIHEAKLEYGGSFRAWAEEWYAEYGYSALCQLARVGENRQRLLTVNKELPDDWRALYETTTLTDDEIAELPSLDQKTIREFKRGKRRDTPELPADKYQIIYVDPPWKYTSGDQHTDTTQETVIGTHYGSMTIDELCQLPISELAGPDCVMFMWVTSPLLEECFSVIRSWGFDYKTSMVWDKVKHNVGNYVSVRHEFVLICARGTPPKVPKLVDSVYVEERTEHSRKPEYFRDLIDDLYPEGKRIELFARGRLPENWDSWGDEANG